MKVGFWHFCWGKEWNVKYTFSENRENIDVEKKVGTEQPAGLSLEFECLCFMLMPGESLKVQRLSLWNRTWNSQSNVVFPWQDVVVHCQVWFGCQRKKLGSKRFAIITWDSACPSYVWLNCLCPPVIRGGKWTSSSDRWFSHLNLHKLGKFSSPCTSEDYFPEAGDRFTIIALLQLMSTFGELVAPVFGGQKTPSPTVTARDAHGFPPVFFVPCFFQRLKSQSHSPSFTCPADLTLRIQCSAFLLEIFVSDSGASLWLHGNLCCTAFSGKLSDGEQQSCWALLLVQRIKLNTYDAMWKNNNNIWQ